MMTDNERLHYELMYKFHASSEASRLRDAEKYERMPEWVPYLKNSREIARRHKERKEYFAFFL